MEGLKNIVHRNIFDMDCCLGTVETVSKCCFFFLGRSSKSCVFCPL
uniref:Uncharacterized protein n=1 Tax=Anguilla anguilla TaxID=7936 RepID=A0A0E9W2P0_ANGAN